MARSFGKILTTIWGDPDWLALSPGAQRLYMLLLSQGGMSLIGRLDVLPHRWATLARGTTVESISTDLLELEGARFVAVDHDTQELIIRTLVCHDMPPGRLNRNLIQGLWTAWGAILSPRLRQTAIDNLPEFVWDRSGDASPASALQMRRSPPLQPTVPTNGSDDQLTPDVVTDHSDRPSELPSPSPSPSPAAAAAANVSRADCLPALSPAERQQRLALAVEILTDRHITAYPTRGNPVRHRNAVKGGKFTDHRPRAFELLAAHPDLDPDGLADALEPPGDPTANSGRPAPPDPLAGQFAAFQRRVVDRLAEEAANLPPPPDKNRNLSQVDRIRNSVLHHPTPDQETPE